MSKHLCCLTFALLFSMSVSAENVAGPFRHDVTLFGGWYKTHQEVADSLNGIDLAVKTGPV